MPFALIAGRSLEVSDVRVYGETFVFVGASGEAINPNFVQALTRSETVNIRDPAVWISTQAVLKLLQMEIHLRKFGIEWGSFLLTGSSALWFFHRCPFKDIDFVVSSEVFRYMSPGPFPVDKRPKLDFFPDYSLEMVMEQQKPQVVPIGFFGRVIPAIHPIDALFGKMCTVRPEIFNERALPRISYVLSFHGRQGQELFLTKCKKAISDWNFPPGNTQALRINAQRAYKVASQLKLPRVTKSPISEKSEIWDFLL